MNKKFDAIIIGGGISGLTAGCYLSKAGLKILLVDKNSKTGGYCRSLTAPNKLRFDTCVHSLSSCRKSGIIGQIIDEFDLLSDLKMNEHDIPDIIFWKDIKLKFYRDKEKNIFEFTKYFPNERNSLIRFFDFIYDSGKLTYSTVRNMTFDQFLTKYFVSSVLRKLIAIPVLISSSVFTSELSAFIGCAILREHIFDGGYYPDGGVGSFPLALENKIKEFGGEVLKNRFVEKIVLEGEKVVGVSLKGNISFETNIVISCCDIHQTFTKFLPDISLKNSWIEKIDAMEPSLSSFCMYIGVPELNNISNDLRSTLYFTSESDHIETTYSSFKKFENDSFLINSPSLLEDYNNVKNVAFLMLTNTYFQNSKFWEKNKLRFKNQLLEKLKKRLPDIFDSISYCAVATPSTLLNWTLNYKGAASGWASTPNQIADPFFKQKTKIHGLYLAGHWMTQAHGVVSAAYTGKRAAELVLKNKS